MTDQYSRRSHRDHPHRSSRPAAARRARLLGALGALLITLVACGAPPAAGAGSPGAGSPGAGSPGTTPGGPPPTESTPGPVTPPPDDNPPEPGAPARTLQVQPASLELNAPAGYPVTRTVRLSLAADATGGPVTFAVRAVAGEGTPEDLTAGGVTPARTLRPAAQETPPKDVQLSPSEGTLAPGEEIVLDVRVDCSVLQPTQVRQFALVDTRTDVELLRFHVQFLCVRPELTLALDDSYNGLDDFCARVSAAVLANVAPEDVDALFRTEYFIDGQAATVFELDNDEATGEQRVKLTRACNLTEGVHTLKVVLYDAEDTPLTEAQGTFTVHDNRWPGVVSFRSEGCPLEEHGLYFETFGPRPMMYLYSPARTDGGYRVYLRQNSAARFAGYSTRMFGRFPSWHDLTVYDMGYRAATQDYQITGPIERDPEVLAGMHGYFHKEYVVMCRRASVGARAMIAYPSARLVNGTPQDVTYAVRSLWFVDTRRNYPMMRNSGTVPANGELDVEFRPFECVNDDNDGRKQYVYQLFTHHPDVPLWEVRLHGACPDHTGAVLAMYLGESGNVYRPDYEEPLGMTFDEFVFRAQEHWPEFTWAFKKQGDVNGDETHRVTFYLPQIP